MNSPSSPRHLLTVWNPSYAADAMDDHLRVLLGWADRHARGEAERDDIYVWWAKIRSPNRRGALPHADDVLAVDEQIRSGVETHLYLTDYRSLYVANLGEVTDDDVAGETSGELDHMPDYYHGRMADFWFRLWDVRRIVADDTPAVIDELKRLRNVRYHGRPVSLYGGMVELPLIVTRDDERSWFADAEALTGGGLWASRDAELRGETERMIRELRDNLLGPEIWHALEPATRTFLAAAEAVVRARRNDPRFDFSGPAIEYAKAVETELNAIVFDATARVLAGRPSRDREVEAAGRHIDLGGRVPHQSLGAMSKLLQREAAVIEAVRKTLRHDANWLLGELPHRLKPLVAMRNPAAHSESTSREAVLEQRAKVLGIGHEGVVVRLGRVKLRAG